MLATLESLGGNTFRHQAARDQVSVGLRCALRTAGTAALLLCAHALAIADSPDEQWPKQLDAITIESLPIFTAEQARARRIYRWINRFHRTTREDAIRKALWHEEGDFLSREDVAEIERNLRSVGVFTDVEVRPVTNNAAMADDELAIHIITRDRVSLFPAILPFSVGGVNGFGAVIIEGNLLGTTDKLSFQTAANSEDERRTRFQFTNRQIGRTFIRADVNASTTEEGDSYGGALTKPFQHLQDPWSWGTSFQKTGERVDFFELGESIAEIPRDTMDVSVEGAWGYGDITGRNALGLSYRFADVEYGEAIGPQPDLVEIPGDTRRHTLGIYHRFRANTRFVVDDHMDRLGVDEDLPLGLAINSFIAISERQEVGLENRTEPIASLDVSWAGQPQSNTYVTMRVAGSARFFKGDTRAFNKNAELHIFNKFASRHTLAFGIDYDEQQELDDLPPQLTLGEDNGLRGYPAREFTGRRRLRLTIEDRYDLQREFFTFKLAAVAFADAGWIGDDSLGSMRTAVGVGLRFGSPQITGGRVLRLDLAVPLDERPGEDFSPTVSFSIGHSFDFFGRRGSLAER